MYCALVHRYGTLPNLHGFVLLASRDQQLCVSTALLINCYCSLAKPVTVVSQRSDHPASLVGAGLHNTGSAAAINQSFTKLQCGPAVEKSQGAWKWKRIAVSDDGTAIVAMTAQEGAPSLWLWTDHKAGLPQHIKGTSKVSVHIHSVCKVALSWLLPFCLQLIWLLLGLWQAQCMPAWWDV